MSDDLAELLKGIKVISNDGTEREMTDQEATDMAQSLNQAAVRSQEEGPRLEAVIERLNEQVPDLEITRIGGNCPVQGEGTYQGEELYFRSRGTHASISVGSTDGESPNSWNPARYAEARVTEEGDIYGAGWITPEEVEIIIPALLANLQEMSVEKNEARTAQFLESVEALAAEMKRNREKND